jgi:hypothetical protein
MMGRQGAKEAIKEVFFVGRENRFPVEVRSPGPQASQGDDNQKYHGNGNTKTDCDRLGGSGFVVG